MNYLPQARKTFYNQNYVGTLGRCALLTNTGVKITFCKLQDKELLCANRYNMTLVLT